MNADQENRERQKQDALLQHLLAVWKDIEYDEKENRQAYPEAHKKLEGIASALQLGAPILPTTTLRELLRWFGAERRGPGTNNVIRTALRIHDLNVNPHLHAARLDDNVEFGTGYTRFKIPEGYTPQPGQSLGKVEAYLLRQVWFERFGDVLSGWIDEHPEATHAEILAKSEELQKLEPTEFMKIETPIPKPENPLPIEDSTIRVSLLKAAKTELVFVSPNDTIGDAITIMEQRGFSQLPVMVGRRTVKGMITWRSICLWLHRGGGRLGKVQDCMETPPGECPIDTPLIEALGEVVLDSEVGVRRRAMDRKLREIEVLPDAQAVSLLELDGPVHAIDEDLREAAE